MKKSNQAFNLPQKTSSVTVFNAVKLQIAVILLFIPTVWLVVEVLIDQWLWQLLVLAVYSLSAMLWLIHKTQKITKEILSDQNKNKSF